MVWRLCEGQPAWLLQSQPPGFLQALHAARLDFRAPQFQRIFRAPLAPDMRAFMLNKMGVAESELAAVLAV